MSNPQNMTPLPPEALERLRAVRQILQSGDVAGAAGRERHFAG